MNKGIVDIPPPLFAVKGQDHVMVQHAAQTYRLPTWKHSRESMSFQCWAIVCAAHINTTLGKCLIYVPEIFTLRLLDHFYYMYRYIYVLKVKRLMSGVT